MWTDDQLKAINAPVTDILVTAAAGSGKTAVMVERIIERIISPDGTDIDKMLIVTFTKAAAAEIRERIAAKITEKLSEDGNERLKKQLALINRASISTIHSFCLDIVRNNFHLLGLDPNFKIADTSQMALLKTKAIESVLEEYYENEEDKEFYRLVNSFTKKSDENIESMILKIHRFSKSMADPDMWLHYCEDVYLGKLDKHISYMLGDVMEDARYSAKIYGKAIKLCGPDTVFDSCRSVLAQECAYAEGIAKLCAEGWDRVYNFVKEHKFSTLRIDKNIDTDTSEQIKSLRNRAKEILKDIAAEKINLPLETVEEDTIFMKPCVSKLCELVRAFDDRYTRFKREKNLIDFSDFEHLALKLLANPEFCEVAENLRNRYDEIYVDEYQDCNGVQEAIFKAVSKEADGKNNMFMVGDMKQSIYRFRNANPLLFKEKSDTFKIYGNGGKQNKIMLSKNFRSRESVLDGVNKIFSAIMSESVGELEYTEEEYLYPGADYENTNTDTETVDINIIDASSDYDDAYERPSNIEAEANFVAKKIHDMVKRGDYTVYDKSAGRYRPLKYSDIVILLRSVQGRAEYFADSLSSFGIPSFSDVGGGYFDCEEVDFLISVIKVISNPMDDIRLVSVMRSPVFRFTDSELLKIRSADRKGCFYKAVQKYLVKGDALSSKLKKFANKLDTYRQQALIMDADEFLQYLIEDIEYMDYIGTLPASGMKKANVRMLINKACNFKSDGGGTIWNFALYVDLMRTSGGDGEGAKLIGENDDVVRIMTIHKSKGLEFPVVFLSMCGKQFNTRDLSEPAIMHNELGIGINYVDEKKRFSYKSTVKRIIAEKILSDGMSEEMRLLYVALTRAREKLIITAVTPNWAKLEKTVESLCLGNGKIMPKAVASCKSFIEWILCSVSATDGESGRFTKRIIPLSDTERFGGYEEDMRRLPSHIGDSIYKGEILRRLRYEYPYSHLSKLPRNVTVTEIKRLGEIGDENTYRLYRMPELRKPSFMAEKSEVSAAYIGTLMHHCMQKIKLTTAINRDTIKEEIERFVNEGIITEKDRSLVDESAIERFFNSEIGEAMLLSGKVFREVPFEMFVDSEEIFAGHHSEEKIVVQGMIDAYFEDKDGNLILVDYKTDRCINRTESEFEQLIISRYKLQMDYYEKALRLLTGKGVHKKYIYLFDTGKVVEIK